MESFIIEGGHALQGEITPQGAKNEALQVICASLLTQDEVRISNIPDILDVNNLIQLLCDIGVKVTKHSRNEYSFKAEQLNLEYLKSDEFVRKCASLRGSVLYNIQAKKLKATYMLLDEASVTGTANVIMAAVLAEGTTTIYNAACEPYIQQLCHLLNAMGANISGIASNLITIVGVKELHGATHQILPDMIEVGSFIGMAAIVGNGIRIKNVALRHLGIIPDVYKRLGVKIKVEGDDLVIPQQKHYVIESFIGSVLIHQKMFESRLFFVDKLIDMGAQIILCDPHRAVVIGHDRNLQLRAGRMTSPDIRAGIALLIAALSAKGTSRIANIAQIDRGYEDIEKRLNALGAHITRVDD